MIFDKKKYQLLNSFSRRILQIGLKKKKRLWMRTFQINNRFAVTSTALYLFGWFGFLVFGFFFCNNYLLFLWVFFFFTCISNDLLYHYPETVFKSCKISDRKKTRLILYQYNTLTQMTRADSYICIQFTIWGLFICACLVSL